MKEYKVRHRFKQHAGKLFGGVLVGTVNSLLGAGGGMVGVPLIKRYTPEQAKAQATCIGVIFPLSIISAILYLKKGYMTFGDAAPYLLPGAVGAVAGAFLLSKIPDNWLRRIFGIFMLWAGIRMMFR